MRPRTFLKLLLVALMIGALCRPASAQEFVEAAKRGDIAVVRRLLQQDPQLVHQGDSGGSTALHWAGANGHVEIMQFLIDNGADINVAEHVEGWTPLMSAASTGEVEATRLLIQRGALLEARRKDGNQAIHITAWLGRVRTIALLLASGVDINASNANGSIGDGDTPLHVAAWHGQMDIGNLLVGAGADINLKNRKGLTARDLAIRNGKTDFANMLDRYQVMLNDRAARDAFRREVGQKIRTSYAIWADPMAQTKIVYHNDFVSNLVGAEWSTFPMAGAQQAPLHVSVTPAGRRHFLGELGSQAARLALNNLPEHSEVAVTFDLFLIRSWDGNNASVGPDRWNLSVVDGPTLLQTTFALFGLNYKIQAYPGEYPGDHYLPRTDAAESDSLGYMFAGEGKPVPMDAVYKMRYTFPHRGTTLQLDFAAGGLQDLADESWGITNIEVSVPVSPVPIAKKSDQKPTANSAAQKATSTPTKKTTTTRSTAKSGGKKTAATKAAGKTGADDSTTRLHDKKTPPKP